MAKQTSVVSGSWDVNANYCSKITAILHVYFMLLKAKNKGISCVKWSQSLAEFSKQHKASEICQAWTADLITELLNYIIRNRGEV